MKSELNQAKSSSIQIMNTSIVYSSLKYIKSNFSLIVKLSRYINDELKVINYTQDKFIKSLNRLHFRISESIIHFVEDKILILDSHLTIRMKLDLLITFEMIKFFTDNGLLITCEHTNLLIQSFRDKNYKLVKLLLDNESINDPFYETSCVLEIRNAMKYKETLKSISPQLKYAFDVHSYLIRSKMN